MTELISELSELFCERGALDYGRSDNGSESTADLVRGWFERLGVKTLSIAPRSPWEKGQIESVNLSSDKEQVFKEAFDDIAGAKMDQIEENLRRAT